ncbi:hypothetical protein Lfu02_54980 [Longispora fulva]|uniref:Uncharacterized protein n=1 Tax=Longispora fulva TaxID=619741 RepID=A0A8J7KGL8_9ACTN|nr:Gp19/Gp15/Gp42 family protein [Longispora fulva]MBG6137520.1 hypothetical protein [Longispora fulva]GIG61126.1 hypothetical protein Lfu02_54980 [Longispora fulva]
MLPLATLEDLQARRPISIDETERPRAEALLEDVSAVIRDALGLPGLAIETAPPLVRVMTCRIVLRVLDNPGGFVSEQMGSYSYRRSKDSTDAGILLSDTERRALMRSVGKVLAGTTRTPIGIDDRDRATHAGGVNHDLTTPSY